MNGWIVHGCLIYDIVKVFPVIVVVVVVVEWGGVVIMICIVIE